MVVRAAVFLFLAVLAVMAVALISALSAGKGEVRRLPRGLWVLAILLLPLVGPALYLWLGRPVRVPPPGARPGGWSSRPPAPDDDPDFLRRLGHTTRPDSAGPGGPRPGSVGPGEPRPGDVRPAGDSRTADDRPPADA